MPQHIEHERKYDTEADFVVPDLRKVPGCARVGEPVRRTLHARYFDTDDLRLAARGITLRCREGGKDAGWHLKLPVAKNVKREIQAPIESGTGTAPPDLAALVAPQVRGQDLRPIAELETHRTERALLDDDGQVLAEFTEDTVRATRLRPEENEVALVAWRELEVEAVNGTEGLLDAVDDHLRRAGARTSPVASKLERTLDDELVRVRRHSATRTAGDVLLTYVGEQYERLLSYDPLVRLSDHDDDSVHKMRVSVRRIRSVLRTHRRLTASVRLAPLDAELKWLADALGEVRDLEVMTARLDGKVGHPKPGWLTGMAADERRARERLKAVLLSDRYYALLDDVETLLAVPPFQDRAERASADETATIVRKAWRKMNRRLTEAEKLPDGSERDEALHRTRKAAKRLRYTAEAARPALGSPAGKLARRAERLQDVLGAQHDGVVTLECLSGIAGRPETPPKELADLDRLTEAERRAMTHVPDDLPAAAKKAAKRKPVRKMRKG